MNELDAREFASMSLDDVSKRLKNANMDAVRKAACQARAKSLSEGRSEHEAFLAGQLAGLGNGLGM